MARFPNGAIVVKISGSKKGCGGRVVSTKNSKAVVVDLNGDNFTSQSDANFAAVGTPRRTTRLSPRSSPTATRARPASPPSRTR